MSHLFQLRVKLSLFLASARNISTRWWLPHPVCSRLLRKLTTTLAESCSKSYKFRQEGVISTHLPLRWPYLVNIKWGGTFEAHNLVPAWHSRGNSSCLLVSVSHNFFSFFFSFHEVIKYIVLCQRRPTCCSGDALCRAWHATPRNHAWPRRGTSDTVRWICHANSQFESWPLTATDT